jgi:HD-like signal output (HDOD) protein
MDAQAPRAPGQPPLDVARQVTGRTWLDELRSLHDRHKARTLSPADHPRYLALRARVLAAVVESQNRALGPGRTRRASARISRACQAELTGDGWTERSLTVDLGVSGCAALLARPVRPGERVRVNVRVIGGRCIDAGATVVATRPQQGKAARVSFAFDPLGDDARTLLELRMLEDVLAELWRYEGALSLAPAEDEAPRAAAPEAAAPPTPELEFEILLDPAFEAARARDAAPRALEDALVEALSGDPATLPPYPAVALRVQQLVAAGSFDFGELARAVGLDAALAADVLRCANSAMFSRGKPIVELQQAVTTIGSEQVARIALASGLAAHAQSAGALASIRREIWIESVASAVISQELARVRGLAADVAFVAGLLHEFGNVVVCTALERILAQRPGPELHARETWLALLDRHHVAAGHLLARRWGLPPVVADVIALHHAADASACSDPGILAVVRAADEVVPLLAGSPRLTGEDLRAIRALRGARERDAVLRVVDRIAGFVAAIESGTSPLREAPSAIARPPTVLAPGERPLDLAVTITAAGRVERYAAVAIATNGLVVVGSPPIRENVLVHLAIDAAPCALRLWAAPRLCREDGASHRIELRPFGLSGELRDAWDALFAAAE